MEAISSAEEITRELMSLLPTLYRLVSYELRKDSSDDTTVVQIRVLSHLIEQPMTLSELARKRRVSLQAASEHTQGLVDRGWIVRVQHPTDRRQFLLHVTDEGRKQYENSREAVVKYLTPMMEQLAPDETEIVHRALLSLHRVLQEPSID